MGNIIKVKLLTNGGYHNKECIEAIGKTFNAEIYDNGWAYVSLTDEKGRFFVYKKGEYEIVNEEQEEEDTQETEPMISYAEQASLHKIKVTVTKDDLVIVYDGTIDN